MQCIYTGLYILFTLIIYISSTLNIALVYLEIYLQLFIHAHKKKEHMPEMANFCKRYSPKTRR